LESLEDVGRLASAGRCLGFFNEVNLPSKLAFRRMLLQTSVRVYRRPSDELVAAKEQHLLSSRSTRNVCLSHRWAVSFCGPQKLFLIVRRLCIVCGLTPSTTWAVIVRLDDDAAVHSINSLGYSGVIILLIGVVRLLVDSAWPVMVLLCCLAVHLPFELSRIKRVTHVQTHLARQTWPSQAIGELGRSSSSYALGSRTKSTSR